MIDKAEQATHFTKAELRLMEWVRQVDGGVRRFAHGSEGTVTTAIRGSELGDEQLRLYLHRHGGRLKADYSNLESVYHLYMPPHIHAAFGACLAVVKASPLFGHLTCYQLVFGNQQNAGVFHFKGFVAAMCNYQRLNSGLGMRSIVPQVSAMSAYAQHMRIYTQRC